MLHNLASLLRNFFPRCRQPVRTLFPNSAIYAIIFATNWSSKCRLVAQASLTCRKFNCLCLLQLRVEFFASTCFWIFFFRVCFGENSPILFCGKSISDCLVLVSFMQWQWCAIIVWNSQLLVCIICFVQKLRDSCNERLLMVVQSSWYVECQSS